MKTTMMMTMILAGSMVAAAEPTTSSKTLAARSGAAVSASDHAEVSRALRLHAQELDATAARHEAEAAQIGPNRIGAPAKWPGMAVNTPYERAKRSALEARRTASESRELALKHTQLAMEAAFAVPSANPGTSAGN
jgi:hypothetical protein